MLIYNKEPSPININIKKIPFSLTILYNSLNSIKNIKTSIKIGFYFSKKKRAISICFCHVGINIYCI